MKINVDTTPLLFFLVCNDTMLSDIWHTLLHHTHQSQFLAVCQVSAFCLLKKKFNLHLTMLVVKRTVFSLTSTSCINVQPLFLGKLRDNENAYTGVVALGFSKDIGIVIIIWCKY